MQNMEQVFSAAAIEGAMQTIAPHVRRTPVLLVDGEEFGLPGIRIAFKLEYLQCAGSFKARGAFFNLLSRPVPAAGIAAASGGNHGAAVAYAAMRLGLPATIFVPGIASPAKLEQIASYGAVLKVGGERYADALAACEAFLAQSGAMSVHAFDQVETLMGQATLGLELERDAPGLDAVLIAVGGGGLIGGVTAWYQGRTRVVGVEPELAPTLARALEAGQPVDAPAGGIAADSLAPKQVGRLAFPILRKYGVTSLLVTDEAIIAAQAALWRVLRVVAEPGGAAAFAALQSGVFRAAAGATVGVVLCGANTSAVKFT
jgi:threonine dehydratase